MMKILSPANNIIVLSFVFLFSISISAQTNSRAKINQIEAYSKRIDTLAKRQKNPNLIFADVADYRTATDSIWRKFNSPKALKKIESYDVASIWQKNGKIVNVYFEESSPSGDWMQSVDHYYREDGTLAKVEARLNTFAGNVSVVREFYYDRNGKLLNKTAKYYDLDTKKAKKRSEVSFFDQEVDIFKNTGKLPFASLL